MDAEGEFDEVAEFDGVTFLFGENFDGDSFWRRRDDREEALAKAAEARSGRPVVEAEPDVDAFVAGVFEDGVEAKGAEVGGGIAGEGGNGGAEFGSAGRGTACGLDGVSGEVEIEGKNAGVAVGAREIDASGIVAEKVIEDDARTVGLIDRGVASGTVFGDPLAGEGIGAALEE